MKTLNPHETIAAAKAAINRENEAFLSRHAKKSEERRSVIDLWAPVDEVVKNMRDRVNAVAEAFQNDHRISFLQWLAGGLDDTGQRRDGQIVHKTRAPELPDFMLYGELKARDVIGLFPDLVKARLEAILRSEPYEAGPPMSARLEMLERLDRDIRAIEDEHEAFVETAVQSGIELAHLPEVQARRNTAAARARDEQERLQYLAAVKRDEDALSAIGVPRPPRYAPSEYLATGKRSDPA